MVGRVLFEFVYIILPIYHHTNLLEAMLVLL